MFALTIKTTNAAFKDNGDFEVARLLRYAADQIEGHGAGSFGDSELVLRDINGNSVGEAAWK